MSGLQERPQRLEAAVLFQPKSARVELVPFSVIFLMMVFRFGKRQLALTSHTLCLVVALCALPSSGYAQEHSCSATEAKRADSQVNGLRSWDALFEWYRAYHQCDDGGIAEGISEVVARNLVDRWETLPQFAQLAAKTPAFGHFVIRHVDETLDSNDLKKIHANAANRCPTKLRGFCDDLKKAADPTKG